MDKAKIVRIVAANTGVKKDVVEEIFNSCLSCMKEAVCRGEDVRIGGMYTLGVKHRAEKVGRELHGGGAIRIPARCAPYAKFSKEIRDRVSGLTVE